MPSLKEITSKLRKYEIRMRKVINSHMQGDYKSVFKGSGLEFDDVRPYQYGDDIRSIDWNVTAKGQGTFVKTYKEEKEQSVFLLLDVSASQDIGSEGKKKSDVAQELAGVLALSAGKEQSSLGLMCFSDQTELYIKPGKGIQHTYRIIHEIFNLQPKSPRTNLNSFIRTAMGMIKKKSIIILISDFIDTDYEKSLKSMARHHDLIVIHLVDTREKKLPGLGIVPMRDKESGRVIWMNTSSVLFKNKIETIYTKNKKNIEELCKKNQADYLEVPTNEDFVPSLIRLFSLRNRTTKSSA
ncbi:MAG: DUF58 domain-containing protein [Cyclobacteriaceae bacterium]|nr:DUF58 domain-containing protein [Cyclobacteriaceae bacterium]MCH8515370.1 DUF58 domain-containing protein [Cyclobacteriaceae bacterium]